jgi:non-specific serine/threonine protein kinase
MWSYDLLSSIEQAWFPRLGIFTGGWSLKAVEAMMRCLGTDGDVPISPPQLLEQLMDSSLLVKLPEVGGQERFTMLETLREYALERLTEQGEFERLRNWQAYYYLEVAERAEIGLRGPEQLLWLARLAADRDNFRAALEWSLSRARSGMSIDLSSFFEKGKEMPRDKLPALELCLRLAAALRPYWEWQGYLFEGRDWLRAVLALPIEDGAGKTLLAARAKALSEAARLVCLQNDQVQATELADESIALWRQLDNPEGLAMALLHRGWAAYASGEYEVAKRMYWEEGLQQLPPDGDTWLRAQLLFHLGAAAGFTFDFEQMRSFYAQCSELFEQVGDRSSVADVLKDQGGMSLLEGNCEQAINYLLKSLKMCYELGHRQFMTTGLCLLGLAFGLIEKPTPTRASIHSAQISGAAENLMETIGLTPWTRTNPFIQMIHQQIRSRVDEESWQEAWDYGCALTAEQVINLACRLGEEVLS